MSARRTLELLQLLILKLLPRRSEETLLLLLDISNELHKGITVGTLGVDFVDLGKSLLHDLKHYFGFLAILHVLGELEKVGRVVELLEAQLNHRVDAVLDLEPVPFDLLAIDGLGVLLLELYKDKRNASREISASLKKTSRVGI